MSVHVWSRFALLWLYYFLLSLFSHIVVLVFVVAVVDRRATMELQIKTAMQMRDQGHALKQKALDLVTEAEQQARKEEGN